MIRLTYYKNPFFHSVVSNNVVFQVKIIYLITYQRFPTGNEYGGAQYESNIERTKIRPTKVQHHHSQYSLLHITPERFLSCLIAISMRSIFTRIFFCFTHVLYPFLHN